MSSMTEVLVEHELTAAWLSVDAPSGFTCMCGAQHSGTYPDLSPRRAYAIHVAEELVKAGYGLMPDVQPEFGARVMLVNGLSPEPEGHGPKRNPNWITKSTHFRLVGPWVELAEPPTPLIESVQG